MADRISIVYDANVDDLKRKLDELIAKNRELSAYATAAAKALSNIASAQGLSTVNNINNSFNTTVNVLAKVNTNLNQFNTQVSNTNNSVNNFNNSLNSTNNTIDRTGSALGGAGKQVTAFQGLLQRVAARMAAVFAIDQIINFVKGVVQVEREFEILQNRINFVAGTVTGGEAIFARLQKTSNELGIGIQELAQGFSGFAIAAKMAGFTSTEAEVIFSNVATALRAAGANSLQTQRAFYALQQMLSKGVVAAEELRRQLGEALPGASDLMTRAYNRLHPGQELTNRQFTKMLEDGKIISAEILPEFARVLQEEFGPALSGKKNSLDAILTRISNQWIEFKKNVGNLDFIKNAASELSLFMSDINNMITNKDLTFLERIDGFMRAGTRLNQHEIKRNKELASQGSLLAMYYLRGERILQESEQAAKKRADSQTQRSNAIIQSAEKEYEVYKKLNEIEQARLENEIRMRIRLSDADIFTLSDSAKATKDLYDKFGKAIGLTREEWNRYADAGEDVIRAQMRLKTGGDEILRVYDKERKAVQNSINLSIESTKKIKEEDETLLGLIKTRRISDNQRGGGDSKELTKLEAERKKIKAAEEAMFKAKNALEESLVKGESSERQLELSKDLIDKTVAYKILKEKAGAEEAKNIRIEAEKEIAIFALEIDLNLLKAKKANLVREGESINEIQKQILEKESQIAIINAQSLSDKNRIIAEEELKALKSDQEELKDLRNKELSDYIVSLQDKLDATKEGSKERLDLELSVLGAQRKMELNEIQFSLKSNTEKEEERNKIIAKYAKKRRELTQSFNKQEEDDMRSSKEKIVDILREAAELIERNEGDSYAKRIAKTRQMFDDMARKIKEAMGKTGDFELLVQLTKALGEVETAGKKATQSIALERVTEIAQGFGNVYGEIAKLQSTAYDNEAIALKKQLDQKLISEQEYERKAAELAKRRFEHEKKTATVTAIIDGALGVMRAISKARWWEVGAITAATGIQVATIQSQQFPGFKEGVIDLKGPGTETSDSIPARLSRGESIMTAEETKRYKPALQAIRDGEFEAFVAKKYTDSIRSQNETANGKNSFAENVVNSFDMQTAELASLLKQNRRVSIKNVDEFAKAVSRRSTTDKVINRRRFK